jgi:hypothetical protein
MNNQNPKDAMSDFENIQRLMRLKRFEQPGEGFTEQFLKEFHQRQRSEMLQQSSLHLMWERTTTWWNNLMVPKWSLATAAAAVCVMSVWLLNSEKTVPAITTVEAPVPTVIEKPFIPKMDLSELPMANIADRNNKALEESLLRKHLEIRPVLEGKVQPLPASAEGFQVPVPEKKNPTAQQKKTVEGLGK